jgi:hypothetical protein
LTNQDQIAATEAQIGEILKPLNFPRKVPEAERPTMEIAKITKLEEPQRVSVFEFLRIIQQALATNHAAEIETLAAQDKRQTEFEKHVRERLELIERGLAEMLNVLR